MQSRAASATTCTSSIRSSPTDSRTRCASTTRSSSSCAAAARSPTRWRCSSPRRGRGTRTWTSIAAGSASTTRTMMEPWDGPALVAFTDGRMIGGTLDRNGLRPARYVVTDDDFVVLASEAGALDVPAGADRLQGPHQAGPHVPRRHGARPRDRGRGDQARPRRAPPVPRVGRRRTASGSTSSPSRSASRSPIPRRSLQHQAAFGYTQEELSMVLTPMAVNGEEPIGSMGTDTPLAVLSHEPQLLYGYFKQLFAQVTNPPIDPIREQLVMSLSVNIGPRTNVLGERAGARAPHPRARPDPHERAAREDPLGRRARGRPALPLHHAARALPRRRRGARAAPRPRVALPARVAGGARGEHDARHQRPRRRRRLGADPLAARHRGGAPSPRARGTAHRGRHHRRDGRGARRARTSRCSSATARARSTRTSRSSRSSVSCAPATCRPSVDEPTAEAKYIKAAEKGLLKVISKMGISTIQSYCGAQVFEAIGLGPRAHRALLHRHRVARRRDRDRAGRGRDAPPSPRGLRRRAAARPSRLRQQLSLPEPGGAPQLESPHDLHAAAGDAHQRREDVRGVLAARERRARAPLDAARAARVRSRARLPCRSTKSSRRRRS